MYDSHAQPARTRVTSKHDKQAFAHRNIQHSSQPHHREATYEFQPSGMYSRQLDLSANFRPETPTNPAGAAAYARTIIVGVAIAAATARTKVRASLAAAILHPKSQVNQLHATLNISKNEVSRQSLASPAVQHFPGTWQPERA